MWRLSFVVASTTRLRRLLYRCSIWYSLFDGWISSANHKLSLFSRSSHENPSKCFKVLKNLIRIFRRISGNPQELLSSFTMHRQLMWRFLFVIASAVYTVSAVSSTVALIDAFIYHLWTVIFFQHTSISLQLYWCFIVYSRNTFMAKKRLFLNNDAISSCYQIRKSLEH